ncbi:hypothetical protein BDZ89DRAFT_1078080 [Hymenopellis radicata]|nr:hypothetical protein BDZ89DRAFT_1078080 [Hymenopellis radicata]
MKFVIHCPRVTLVSHNEDVGGHAKRYFQEVAIFIVLVSPTVLPSRKTPGYNPGGQDQGYSGQDCFTLVALALPPKQSPTQCDPGGPTQDPLSGRTSEYWLKGRRYSLWQTVISRDKGVAGHYQSALTVKYRRRDPGGLTRDESCDSKQANTTRSVSSENDSTKQAQFDGIANDVSEGGIDAGIEVDSTSRTVEDLDTQSFTPSIPIPQFSSALHLPSKSEPVPQPVSIRGELCQKPRQMSCPKIRSEKRWSWQKREAQRQRLSKVSKISSCVSLVRMSLSLIAYPCQPAPASRLPCPKAYVSGCPHATKTSGGNTKDRISSSGTALLSSPLAKPSETKPLVRSILQK